MNLSGMRQQISCEEKKKSWDELERPCWVSQIVLFPQEKSVQVFEMNQA